MQTEKTGALGERLERLRHILQDEEIDGALLSHNMDVYYLTLETRPAHLWVPATDGPPLMLFPPGYPTPSRAGKEKLPHLSDLQQLPEYIRNHFGRGFQRIGLTLDILPTRLYLLYRDLFPGQEMVDVSNLMRRLRMVKSPAEIACIREAARIADRMYAQVPAFLQEAETELELAVKIEAFYRSLGHPGVVPMRAFNAEFVYGHILAGASGSAASASAGPTGGRGLGPFFSQGAGRSRIHHGEPILIDYSPSVKGYLCDQCRVFSIGKLPRELVDAHQVMLEIQDAIAVKGKPATRTADLYELALRKVERAGLSRGFMGHPEPVSFVGHGLGLELDEWPVVSGKFPHPLEAGMILALEPKYVSPGRGVVGIENTFVVTDRGMEKLNAFPDDIHVL